MKIKQRILLEARYIISLNKNIKELVPIIKVSERTISRDIKYRLKNFDTELYNRVIKILENC